MKFRIDFTWYRDRYNQDNVTNFAILEAEKASKKAVTQAIRDYVKDWTGKGYVQLSDITATFDDYQQACNIAQRKFIFSN